MVRAWWVMTGSGCRHLGHAVEHVAEALELASSSGVHFVQHADRGRVHQEHAKTAPWRSAPVRRRQQGEGLQPLAGGREKISRPASSGSSDSVKVSLASPPSKQLDDSFVEIGVDLLERGQQSFAAPHGSGSGCRAAAVDGAGQSSRSATGWSGGFPVRPLPLRHAD